MQHGSIGSVPDSQHAVKAAGDYETAVRCRSDAVNEIRAAGKSAEVLTVVRPVKPYGPVARTGHCIDRITDESNVCHLFVEAGNRPGELAGRSIPDADRRVGAATGQRSSVRFPGNAEHVFGVPFKRPDQFARCRLENPDVLVGPAGSDHRTVGREPNALDAVRVWLRQRPHPVTRRTY